MPHRTVLRAAVAATALGIALTGSGVATAAPAIDPVGRGHHSGSAALLSGSAEAGSAAAGSAAELAACALLEAVIPLPVCLLLI
ncbi:hypothetical protein [Nocardia sp. NPDC058497]|uniref:hypothetical protein n=1 Tax=Nocardia sp. NPDC058497 TaxID=3346529 RepID=UPI00364DFBA0